MEPSALTLPRQEQQQKQPPRHIYNPFLCAILHSKAQYLALLRAYYEEYHCRESDNSATLLQQQRNLLLCDNFYDRALVADVHWQLSEDENDDSSFDVYHTANYEYALYRMLMLCHPRDTPMPEYVSRGPSLGSPNLCDLKCQVLLDSDSSASHNTLRRALLSYAHLQYFTAETLRDYERVSQARARLLYGIKRSGERKETRDVLYNRELTLTALYISLISELIAQCESEKRPVAPLFQSLHQILGQHYETTLHESALTSGASASGSHRESYMRVGRVGDARYLRLQENRALYEYVARRFMLDVDLRRSGDSPQTCDQDNVSLGDFYQQCERYAYQVLQYSGESERSLHIYLEHVQLELVPLLDYVLHKNLWQLQRLHALLGEGCASVHSGLLQALDWQALISIIKSDYESEGGGPDARVSTLLKQYRDRPLRAIEKWQTHLAIDVDVVLSLLRAMAQQQNLVERTIQSQSQRQAYAKTRGAVTRLYSLYIDALREALKK